MSGPSPVRRGSALLVVGVVLLAGAVAGLVLALRYHHTLAAKHTSATAITLQNEAAPATPTATPRPTAVTTTVAPATRATHQQQPPVAASGPTSGRLGVVTAYYDAINDQDWSKVWSLGGKNLGETYTSMVNGYADTAHDDAYITGLSGDVVDVTLLAFEDSGKAQLYNGALTIESGEIESARQSLIYSDSNGAFELIAHDWYGHDRDVEITPGGLSVMSFRTFKNCARLSDGCDQFVGNNILNGGLIVFQLTDGQGNTAIGHVRSSTVRVPYRVTMTENRAANTLSFNLLPDAPFCGPHAATGGCDA